MESDNSTEFISDVNDDVPVIYNSSFSNVVWSVIITVTISLVFMMYITTCIKVLVLGQKTRNQQPRRGAVFNGSRSRPSLSSHEPTIYVSPSNLPPPPKYECLAPPSYEEVVGIHYPNYQAQQPIAQPIATALAQSTQPSTTAQDSGSDTRNNDTVVVTVNERPTVTNT